MNQRELDLYIELTPKLNEYRGELEEGDCWFDRRTGYVYYFSNRYGYYQCSCGETSTFTDHSNFNPNYETDPVALLRVMMGREDWLGDDGFHELAFHSDNNGAACYPSLRMADLLTTPGLLAKVVLEWLKGREK